MLIRLGVCVYKWYIRRVSCIQIARLARATELRGQQTPLPCTLLSCAHIPPAFAPRLCTSLSCIRPLSCAHPSTYKSLFCTRPSPVHTPPLLYSEGDWWSTAGTTAVEGSVTFFEQRGERAIHGRCCWKRSWTFVSPFFSAWTDL